MTEKHHSPLLESPLTDASLSSDDEEQLEDIVVEEEVKVKGGKNEEGIKEEEAKEKEDDEEEDDNSRFSIKKRVVVPSPQPQSSSSSMGEEEEESDSESAGSDSNLVPPPPESNIKFSNNTDVEKPITSSVPMAMEEANAKQKKKSTSKTNSTAVTPMKQRPAKRSASEADNKPGEEEEEVSKRRKKKNGGHDGEESEMKSSNTVWSKGDEVIILKGLLSMYKNHGATKPISEMISQLHENVKASLHAEVTNNQLYGKVRKLKQKYFKGGMICGSKVYGLAKKIWGTSVKEDFKVGEETADQTMAINGTRVVDSAAATSKKEGKSSRRKASNVVVSPQQLRNELVSTKQSRSLPSFFNEVIESGMNSIVPLEEGLKGFLAKEVLGFIGSSKAKALEEKWNKLQIAEAKIYLDRIDLVKELVELVLDAIGGIEE